MTSDVIIIGASVAGLSTTLALLKNGIVPVLLERKQRIGIPVQCAEYVPAAFAIPAPSVIQFSAQKVSSLETHIIDYDGRKFVGVSKCAGFNLDRDKWEQKLASEVICSGGVIFLSSPVISISYEDGWYVAKTNKRNFRGKVLVGADGPISLVARYAGFPTQKLMPAIQWIVPLKNSIDKNFVLFHPEITAGYGWLFPKGDVANLGIGSFRASERKLLIVAKYFEEFIVPRPVGVTGGVIPVGGMRERIFKDNILLVGDSAGLADPITGAGIANAYESGQLACSVISRLLHGNVKCLVDYEKEMYFIARSLMRSREKRIFMESNWDDREKFIANIRRVWLPAKCSAQ